MAKTIIVIELSSEFLNRFAATHTIDQHAIWCVSERCIEIYNNGEFAHYLDGQWHQGKMPEYKTIKLQTENTGRLMGRYISNRRGTWYNKDVPIK